MDFLLNALLGGIGVTLLSGPLGSFIVWRRMAYFGDALAHAGLLGIALSLIFQLPMFLGILILATLFSIGITLLKQQRYIAYDSLLAILSHGSLAIGVICIASFDNIRVNLHGYLFGDILAISQQQIYLIYTAALIGLSVLAWIWKPLLLTTIHQDLAYIEGVATQRIQFIFMILVSLLVALAIHIVGVLLITSLLIIPAATARRISSTPETMALLATVTGVLAVAIGLYGSLLWDSPAGPSIVVSLLLLCVVTYSVTWKKSY